MQTFVPATYKTTLGSAWAGSSVNCKTYATEPILFAVSKRGTSAVYGAFFNHNGEMTCYRWRPRIDEICIMHSPVLSSPYDAHHTISVQIDDDDTLHIVGGSHRSKPFYFLWKNCCSDGYLEDISHSLPDETKDASYPSLISTQDGNRCIIFLMYRLGSPYRSQWRVISRLGSSSWKMPSKGILSGISSLWPSGPYPNQPMLFDDGRIGIPYCWRSQSIARGRLDPMQVGIDYVEFSSQFARATTNEGIGLSIPVAPSNSGRIIAVPWGADLANQCGSAVLSDQTAAFVSIWREKGNVRQIQFCWRTLDGDWRHTAISRFRSDVGMRGSGTLPSPYSRPAVIPGPNATAIVLFRDPVSGGRLVAQVLSPPDYNPSMHRAVTLVRSGLDQYEPVADRLGSIKSGLLTCYVQRAEQILGGDEMRRESSAPAYLLAWEIADIIKESRRSVF